MKVYEILKEFYHQDELEHYICKEDNYEAYTQTGAIIHSRRAHKIYADRADRINEKIS